MNREIKFKVFTDENKMIGPFDLSQNPIHWNGLRDGVRLQFTGLHDKNGAEIYEGDVIKDDTKTLKLVSFEGGTFGCKVKKKASFYSEDLIEIFYTIYEYVLGGIELEILGNIYEKENLLKQKDGN